jgi:serine/threonine-protein kinase RsbW
MRMNVAFWLPRTAASVAVARQTLEKIFTALGVRFDCRDEIALAVSEACSNAVRHGSGQPGYEIEAESEDSHCVITVNNDGSGLGESTPYAMPAADAVTGRGLAIMRITTDSVAFRRRSGGLSVRLSKRLRWKDDAIGNLSPEVNARRRPCPGGGPVPLAWRCQMQAG